MSEKSTTRSGGIGVLGILGCIFVTLKLLGHIDWSWWWVTAPFWGGFAFILAIFIIVGAILIVAEIIDRVSK